MCFNRRIVLIVSRDKRTPPIHNGTTHRSRHDSSYVSLGHFSSFRVRRLEHVLLLVQCNDRNDRTGSYRVCVRKNEQSCMDHVEWMCMCVFVAHQYAYKRLHGFIFIHVANVILEGRTNHSYPDDTSICVHTVRSSYTAPHARPWNVAAT